MEILKSAKDELKSAPLYYLGEGLAVFAALYFVFCMTFPIGWEHSADYMRWRLGVETVHYYEGGKTCEELGGRQVLICDRTNYTAYGMPVPNYNSSVNDLLRGGN